MPIFTWAKSIQFLLPSSIALALGIFLIASRFEINRVEVRLKKCQEIAAAAITSNEMMSAALQQQSDGIEYLAKASKQTQATVIEAGKNAAIASRSILAQLRPLSARADVLTARQAGPPETACIRAAETMREVSGKLWGPTVAIGEVQ